MRVGNPVGGLQRIHLRDEHRHADRAGMGPDPNSEHRDLRAELRPQLSVATDGRGVGERDGSLFQLAVQPRLSMSQRLC